MKEDHKTGSYEYMARVKRAWRSELPELSAYFQSGGLVDAVLNLGLPAPIDVQVAGSNMQKGYSTALQAGRPDSQNPAAWPTSSSRRISIIRRCSSMSIAHAPASSVSTSRKWSTTSSPRSPPTQMIAPSFWIDPKTGNDYMLTVQYPEDQVKSLADLKAIPLRARRREGIHAAR